MIQRLNVTALDLNLFLFCLSVRSTTYYLADRRYDMLPAVLSADLCSLLGGVDRSVNSTSPGFGRCKVNLLVNMLKHAIFTSVCTGMP